MNRLLSCFLAGALAASASPAASAKYYALELKGGSRVFSVDAPVRKGRVLLFHRYPDGTYMSLAASEVEKVVAPRRPSRQPETLAPGGTVYVGNAVEGPGYAMPPAPPQPAAVPGVTWTRATDTTATTGEEAGATPAAAAPAAAAALSRIGPNGFPILAPPGTPGSVPPPIGANGFPILAPPPPVASPRRHVVRAALASGRARGGGRRRQRRLRDDHGRAQAHGHRRDVLSRRRDGASAAERCAIS